MTIAAIYAHFAAREAHGVSPAYERLSLAVCRDDVLALLGTLPPLPKPPGEALHNVLALDGTPLAWPRSHGQAIIWFA
jgi:hypothetical protein